MVTQTATATRPNQELSVEQQLKKLQDIYADAPEVGRVALEKIMRELEAAVRSRQKAATAGRIGVRQGKVSELTVDRAVRARRSEAAARRFCDAAGRQLPGRGRVGTVHDMRFVFLDNDTKLLFATAYDGDWDPYIDDFATKIPDCAGRRCSAMRRAGQAFTVPPVKDWIVKHQITADAWYVANPNLTVAETRRLEKVGKAVDELLDKIG